MLSHLILTGALAFNGLKSPNKQIIREAGVECIVEEVPVHVDSTPVVDNSHSNISHITATNVSATQVVAVHSHQYVNNSSKLSKVKIKNIESVILFCILLSVIVAIALALIGEKI